MDVLFYVLVWLAYAFFYAAHEKQSLSDVLHQNLTLKKVG